MKCDRHHTFVDSFEPTPPTRWPDVASPGSTASGVIPSGLVLHVARHSGTATSRQAPDQGWSHAAPIPRRGIERRASGSERHLSRPRLEAIRGDAIAPLNSASFCMKQRLASFFFGALMTTCHHCQADFTLKRSTGRFCGPTCRVAGHRRPAQPAQGAILSVTGHPTTRPHVSAPDVTLRRPNLPPGIAPDDRWPGMYRIRLPGGGLSDMVNLTRARECATPRSRDRTGRV